MDAHFCDLLVAQHAQPYERFELLVDLASEQRAASATAHSRDERVQQIEGALPVGLTAAERGADPLDLGPERDEGVLIRAEEVAGRTNRLETRLIALHRVAARLLFDGRRDGVDDGLARGDAGLVGADDRSDRLMMLDRLALLDDGRVVRRVARKLGLSRRRGLKESRAEMLADEFERLVGLCDATADDESAAVQLETPVVGDQLGRALLMRQLVRRGQCLLQRRWRIFVGRASR